MTLGRIKWLALKMLDEAPEDIGEYDGLFKTYANMGYAIAVREYLRPREWRILSMDENGCVGLLGMGISRVVELRDRQGRRIPFSISADGAAICTQARDQELTAVCEVQYPEMDAETDEPRLPEFAHPALADYICYRHLSCGSMAKQSRAQFFLNSFLQQMRAIRQEGLGSVTRLNALYEASDVRYSKARGD